MLEEQVLETINKYSLIQTGDSIIVGVSGGPDSICLLNILNKFKEQMGFKIIACHVNHSLRKNAILDEEYVINFCKSKEIRLFTRRVDVRQESQMQKISKEEAGRQLRYNFFCEIMKQTNSNKIATAHNANDNAETIIMNLLRGSATSGLKGIEAIRDNIYIRPLIEVERNIIEDYCEKEVLNPRHDESNDENIYTRNKIRNKIIPYIKEEFNPNIIQGLNRLSRIIQDEEKYFIKMLDDEYNNIAIKQNCNYKTILIEVKKFNNLDIAIRRRIILYIVKRLFGTSKGIENIHIEDIIKLAAKNVGNKYLLVKKYLKVSVKSGKLEFLKI